jgi:uncharacterized protein YyaL (SSP411 family)
LLVDDNGNPLYTNRLIHEDSPYLRQHAHNPVDWFPWGEEAFAKARQEDKPVFLSVGYSTCHWCHVMERESFDNLLIAEYLNEYFVSIKLDREQRPDLDDIYMTGTQLMSGHGGWPMSNFLTVQGAPFYSGTYYPAENFRHLLVQLNELWKTKRNEVERQAEEVAGAISKYTNAKSENAQLGGLITAGAEELARTFDSRFGGFGDAPKFPNEPQLMLLLENSRRNDNDNSRRALQQTLDHLYQGGIYDQIAGGFHRYAVDRQWLVPHFEKMLYNQAQLLPLYAQGSVELNKPAYRRIAMEIGDYVLRDMLSPDGAFYSATDADSEGDEGLFFTWTLEELAVVLSVDDLSLVRDVYGVSEEGNFEGRNILHLDESIETFAGDDLDSMLERVDQIKSRLYAAREKRIHPLRDEKVITGWNAMMISAFAVAGHCLDLPRFIEAALRAADYLWQHHWRERRLWRISLGGHQSIAGNLEDYAAFARAAMDLYRITQRREWLDRGVSVIDSMNDLFWDQDGAGYFLSRESEDGPLITRPKSPMDGATPSANSLAISALVQYWLATKDVMAEQKVAQTASAFSGLMVKSPFAFSYMIVALQDYLEGQRGVIQFAAEGKVRVERRHVENGALLEIAIESGWHINANETLDHLVPTRVVGKDFSVQYPDGISRKLAFVEAPFELYEGELSIIVHGSGPFTVELQACDNSRCLAPEKLVFP